MAATWGASMKTDTAGPRCGGSGPSPSTSILSSGSPRADARRAWKRPRRNSWRTGRGTALTRLRPRALLPKPTMSSLRPRALPVGFIAPCLPTRARQPPSGPEWLIEIKHDGFRVIARKERQPGAALQPARQRSNPSLSPDCRSARPAAFSVLHYRRGSCVVRGRWHSQLRSHPVPAA
jgi:hypothetical protein